MICGKANLSVENTEGQNSQTGNEPQRVVRVYRAPELHDVGKAGKLVQGGGGNFGDNNRARQY